MPLAVGDGDKMPINIRSNGRAEIGPANLRHWVTNFRWLESLTVFICSVVLLIWAQNYQLVGVQIKFFAKQKQSAILISGS